MTKQERYQFVINYFQETMPKAETELVYKTSYELLVAVILSAQCTDKRVNQTTPFLFEKYPDLSAMAKAEVEDVALIIKSISYPNSKSNYLVGMAKKIQADFDGEIPLDVNSLIKLPGVGRKTANVITSVLDNQPNMAVDTHVFRVSHRIGLVSPAMKTPLAVENELIKNIPKTLIHRAHHWLILHGRYVCTARQPKCAACGVSMACVYFSRQLL